MIQMFVKVLNINSFSTIFIFALEWEKVPCCKLDCRFEYVIPIEVLLWMETSLVLFSHSWTF